MSEPIQSSSSQAVAQAHEALAKGDIYSARKLLEVEAAKGDPLAANALGELLARQPGKSTAAEAVNWFQSSADAGYAPAHLNLARMLWNGPDGVPSDVDKLLVHLRHAAEAGIPAAMSQLAIALERCIAAPAGPTAWNESREWLEKAVATGDIDGALALARFLDNGLGGSPDPERATALLFAAADAGSALAMNEIGVRLQNGTGTRQDCVSAVGWFTRAAQLGLTGAMVNLGNCYENGIGLLPDIRRAGESYAAAAKKNHPIAQFLLARLFEQGRGTAVNLTFAYVNYYRAAKQGVSHAAERLEDVTSRLTPAELQNAEKLLFGSTAPNPA